MSESIEFSELDLPVVPNPGSDSLVGSAAVDMTALFSGLEEIDGWYNIADYNQHCCGQLKVRLKLMSGGKRPAAGQPMVMPQRAPPGGEDDAVFTETPAAMAPAPEETAVLGEGEGEGALAGGEEALAFGRPGESAGPAAESVPAAAPALAESSVDFHQFTQNICDDLGDLEEKIRSLSPSPASAPPSSRLVDYDRDYEYDYEGRSGHLFREEEVESEAGGAAEDLFLDQIEFTVEEPQGGGEPAPAPTQQQQRGQQGQQGQDDPLDRPAFNFDRIARILSA